MNLAYLAGKFIHMKTSLLLACAGALLAGSQPLATTAQTLPNPPAANRYYVGLGGTVGAYQLAGKQTANILAPVVTGGLRFSPRLAVEMSLVYHWGGFNNSSTGQYLVSDGNGGSRSGPAIFRSVYQERTQAALATARYTLVYLPLPKLRLDVVGGVSLIHSNVYGYNNTLDRDTREVVRGGYYVRYDLTGGGVLLGPSVRCQLGPQVELACEFIGSFALGSGPQDLSKVAGTLGLSARYYFGARSLPPAR